MTPNIICLKHGTDGARTVAWFDKREPKEMSSFRRMVKWCIENCTDFTVEMVLSKSEY